jgi:hypothetical protein
LTTVVYDCNGKSYTLNVCSPVAQPF